MKPTVSIAMSTYNGSLYIERQLDSLLGQKDVKVFITIRDDGSTDDTVNVIEKYVKANSLSNITVIKGDNIGYEKSFWEALRHCQNADYYAFSDQDDYWHNNKLARCIDKMKEDQNHHGPKLSYCKMNRTNINLERLNETPDILKPSVLSKKIVLTQLFAYGASIVINDKAKSLICKCDLPDDFVSSGVGHDGLAGLICYWFGKVYFVDEFLYDWIRYETSLTGSGTKFNGYLYRIKELFSGKTYYNPSDLLLKNYKELLSEEDYTFLTLMKSTKSNFSSRIKLICDKNFKRVSKSGTLALKIGIIMGKF